VSQRLRATVVQRPRGRNEPAWSRTQPTRSCVQFALSVPFEQHRRSTAVALN